MALDHSYSCEVCVIGGGPAGSTMAHRLASLGHDVILIERMAFPRRHIGVSLAPGIVPLLEYLGLNDRAEALPLRAANRMLIQWHRPGDLAEGRSVRPSYQVDRGKFDQMLLEAAREQGVRVIQPATALSPLRRESEGWSVPIRLGDQFRTILSSFLVDASGKRPVLPGRPVREGPTTIALYAYWLDTGFQGSEVRVEARPDHWLWGASLPDGTVSSAIFLDPRSFKKKDGRDISSIYLALLAQSELLQVCLSGELIGNVKACDTSSRISKDIVGKDYLRVGEASFSIDPISSQGVQVAMASAIQGSLVAHTIITQPDMADAAMSFYQQRQIEAVTRNLAWAANCYAEISNSHDLDFWALRSVGSRPPNLLPTPLPPADHCSLRLSALARLMDISAATNNRISVEVALTHPSLERPIAYLGDYPIAPLLRELQEGRTAETIIRSWSRSLPLSTSIRILEWLWKHGIIVRA